MDERVRSKQTSNKQFALTTPRELAAAMPGGKIEVFARLVSPAHTSRANNTD
jgi:hypothetical protein